MAFNAMLLRSKSKVTDVQVMALDGQPAEPFPARNGAVVLAPGGRGDVFIDASAGGGAVVIDPVA